MAEKICSYLKCSETKPDFSPLRKAIVPVRNMDTEKRNALINQNSDYGKIICICGEITKGEIIEAIKRGASTVEAVKRRIGTEMGSCQGSRCSQKITEIIEEYNGKI